MNNEDYLALLPLTRTWLEDIVYSFLKRPDGIGEIDAIVLAIKHTGRDVGDKPESTITRTINNYCVNTGDSERSAKHPIFKHIDRGTYRLLDYPNMPDLIEIQNIKFAEPGFKEAWKYFVDIAKKHPNWGTATKRKKLVTFVRYIADQPYMQKLIEAYGSSIENFRSNQELNMSN